MVVVSKAAASTSAQTLLQQHEAAAQVKNKAIRSRTQVSRRDSDEQTDRAVREHFKQFSSVQTDIILVDGKTLRQTLKTAKKDAKAAGRKLGSGFYQEIGQKFVLPGESDNSLKLVNDKDEIRESLLDALRIANSKNTTVRNKGPLLQWLSVSSAPNQRELVGLMRVALTIKPSSSSTSCQTVLAILKYVVTHDLHNQYEKETSTLREHFDDALSCSWAAMKKEGLPLATFWSCSRAMAAVVTSTADIDKIMGATGAWSQVRGEILRVVAGSTLGGKMFGFVAECLAAESLSQKIDESLAKLKAGNIDAAAVHRCVEACEQESAQHKWDMVLRHKRQVVAMYRNIEIKVQVDSVRDEIEVRLAATIKTLALTNGLEELSFEKSLLGDAIGIKHTIDSSILAEYNVARKSANKMFQDDEWGSGDDLCALLKSKRALLLQFDRSFKLELAVVEALNGQAGATLLFANVLECLPGKGAHPTLLQAGQGIAKVMSSKLYSFVCRETQALVSAAKELIDKLERGASPAITHFKDRPFLKDVVEVLPEFLYFDMTMDDQPASAIKRIYGRPAAVARLDKLQEMQSSGETITLDMVDSLQAFRFILEADEIATLKELTSSVVASAVFISKPKIESSAKRASHPSGSSSSSKKAKMEEEDDVMAFFS